MVSLSKDFISVGRSLTRSFGQNITFTRTTGATFTPSTGVVAGGTTTTFTAFGYVKNTSGDSELPNTTTEQFDLTIWVEVNNSSNSPLIGDVATVGANRYRVLTVQAYIVNAVEVLYKILVRV